VCTLLPHVFESAHKAVSSLSFIVATEWEELKMTRDLAWAVVMAVV
jgi:hypothetical protein